MKNILGEARRKMYSMRYRYFDRFVFIHINKTAGSSIEKALKLPHEHKTALEKIEEIGRDSWDKKLTFAVVRNPWDKVVSHFHYRVKTNQTGLREHPVEFREWVKRAYGNRDPLYYDKPKMFMPQMDWISERDGRILVDEIIHFENISSEFTDLLQTLGKNVTLQHVKRSDRGNYRNYYDQETMEVVRIWFERDIDRLGYRFE